MSGLLEQARSRLEAEQAKLDEAQERIRATLREIKELESKPPAADIEIQILAHRALVERLKKDIKPLGLAVSAARENRDNQVADRKRIAGQLDRAQSKLTPYVERAERGKEIAELLEPLVELVPGTPYYHGAFSETLDLIRVDWRDAANLKVRIDELKKGLAEYDGE